MNTVTLFEPVQADLSDYDRRVPLKNDEGGSALANTTTGETSYSAMVRRLGPRARAAFVISLTGAALAGVTAPGLSPSDPQYEPRTSSVRGWEPQATTAPRQLSWAEAIAIADQEFRRIEFRREVLAEREAMLYGIYEPDEELA